MEEFVMAGSLPLKRKWYVITTLMTAAELDILLMPQGSVAN